MNIGAPLLDKGSTHITIGKPKGNLRSVIWKACFLPTGDRRGKVITM